MKAHVNHSVWLVAASIIAVATQGIAADDGKTTKDKKKVVIPFDFVSKFDDGRYGRMVCDSIWKKLDRGGQFEIPTAQDVRDLCATNAIKLTPDTPLADVEPIVRTTFDAQIGIWGSVERAPGTDGEIYDLSIRCVDFSTPGRPRVIYEKSNVRTNSVSEIPHLYVKEMLDKLYERAAAAPRGVNADAEERWKTGENLVTGDFEEAARGVPKGWEPRAGQKREPLGNLVRWVAEGGNPSNHVVRFTIPKIVAENEGVMYYSQPFAVQEGATYRFQCRWRSTGPSPKVFIKGYAEMPSQYKREKQETDPPESDTGSRNGSSFDRREIYRSQQNLVGEKNVWNTQTQDFTPKHTKYSPKWCKIMLYGYLKEGVIDWDDVVVKQIAPPPAGFVKGPKRLSKESKVTLEEMEENERASQTTREETPPQRKSQPSKKRAGRTEESLNPSEEAQELSR